MGPYALLNFEPTVAVVVVVIMSLLFSLGGLYAVRRLVPHHVLEHHNDVAGFIYAVVGVIYAAILAFVFIMVWEQFSETERVLEKEGSAMASLYREVQAFSGPEQMTLRTAMYLYAKRVADDEWNLMTRGETSQKARDQYNIIWDTLRTMKVKDAAEANWHAEMLKRLNELAENRRIRTTYGSGETESLLWMVLISGGLITICYTYMYGVHRILPQALMTGALAVLIGVTLLSIFRMQHPFTGRVALHPEAFVREIGSFERQMTAQRIPFPEPPGPAH